MRMDVFAVLCILKLEYVDVHVQKLTNPMTCSDLVLIHFNLFFLIHIGPKTSSSSGKNHS